MAALTPCPAARLRASVLQGACQQAPPALVSVTFASSATSWCTRTWTRTSWTTSWDRTPWNRWWRTPASCSMRASATATLTRPCCQFYSSFTGMSVAHQSGTHLTDKVNAAYKRSHEDMQLELELTPMWDTQRSPLFHLWMIMYQIICAD